MFHLKSHLVIKSWIRFCLVAICFLSITTIVFAQNAEELERKQKKLESKIKSTLHQLDKTKQKKETTLKDFSAIQQKITKRQVKVDSVKKDLTFVATKLNRKDVEVARIKQEIHKLKVEYALVMKKAYKANLLVNEWMMILSSSSMNEAFRRWQYLRSFKKQRKLQTSAIAEKQLSLENELWALSSIKSEKEYLLHMEQRQTNLLNNDLKQKNTILNNLTTDEKKLIKSLQDQKSQQIAIQNEIKKAIKKEIERKEKEARLAAEKERKRREAEEKKLLAAEEKAKKEAENEKHLASISSTESAPKSETIERKELSETSKTEVKAVKLTEKKKLEPTETAESAALSNNFQNNRGRLPWPVNNGQVVRRFGRQTHAELSHVTINNNGIDIKTGAGSTAYSIFDGEIVHIAFIAGYKNTVMVNHGKYYSIYSNLEHVNVSKGQKISRGSSIGTAGINPATGNHELHFELWSSTTPMNPLSWLKPK